MSCSIQTKKIIFNVEKISRNKRIIYIFIGDVDESIKKILNKIENKESIKSSTEISKLKQNYKDELSQWIKFIKDKIDIKFIYNYIQINDSISLIRKKIFYYCSDNINNNYILPENQELWVLNKQNEKEIIGFYYEDSNKNKRKIKPLVYTSVDIDEEFKLKRKYVLNNSENNILIYDLIGFLGVSNNTIYFTDAMDEYKYLQEKKKLINTDLINFYFKKHFPYLNLKIDLKDVKNDYLLKKKMFNKELLLDTIFNKYKNNNKIIGECSITSIIFKSNEIESLSNSSVPVDLYQVFDYLREKKLGVEVPFVKYGDESFNIPISIISTDAINNNKINQSMINEWIGINKITTNINGIMVKKYIKDYNDDPKYMSFILRKTNELTFKLNFNSNDNINLNDVAYSLKKCKKLIEDINKNIISKKVNKKQMIDPPDLEINEQDIKLKKNTNLKYCNIYIPIIKNLNINFNELYEFSKKFPEYLYDESRDLNNKNKQRLVNVIKLRYKKVSGFIPMTDIIKDIDILKSKGELDINIIQIISKKYDKKYDDVSKYILEWKKKYRSYMSSKINPEFKIGVEIEISNGSIKLNQITSFYQINIIYNFIKNFLLMFFQENNNSSLNSFINDKKLNKNLIDQNDFIISYEKNIINSYNNIGLDSFELDLIEDKLYSELDNKQSIGYNSNSESSILLPGVANDDDISPELKLKCNDAVHEQDRCADACNDPSYYLRRLQRYDNYLFRFPTKNNKEHQYSTRCGAAQGRQPVILIKNPSENPKINKESYTYSLKYSSKPEEFQRWYICPNIWCPACEIPLSMNEIDHKTIQIRQLRRDGARCKTALCPYDNSHQVIIRETNQIYPGFIENKHPDNYHCLPCCFAKNQQDSIKYPMKYMKYKKCLGEDVEEVNSKNGMIYILGKISPIEKDRYSILPAEVSRILNTRLETGYLSVNKGYVKKGIRHKKNQSFLSCIIDIISCIDDNTNIDENKLKKILIEKLNNDLFRSLHNGNLENIFNDPKHNLTGIQNFKKFLNKDKILIDHKYLWDYLQRENVLYKNGVNLIIFDTNDILCPFGEDIYEYYDENKKSILIAKSENYYEPIYFLEGDGKSAVKKCIFNSDLIEIKKVLEISKDGCGSKHTIDWTQILKKNIDLYKLKIDTISIKFEYELVYTIKEILKAIESGKLNKGFIPKTQYIDSYNKVFGIVLNNNLYIPVKPSKLFDKIKYEIVYNLSTVDLIDYKSVLKNTNDINKNTNLKYKIEHKILDNKDNKYIIALLNSNNRIIPVKRTINKDKSLKVSNSKYFSDINEFITQKILMNDKRIEKINKKNFEDETFNRLRYELSFFLQKNKKYLANIKLIINNQEQYNNKNLDDSRKKMYLILDEIFKKITSLKDKKIDFFKYEIPNKRVPCWMRSTKHNKSNNYETLFKCESDPHCINHNNKCKLYINKINFIQLFKHINNYPYYLSKLLDELLRFKIKREEILNNDIDNILDKNYVPENEDKYIKIQTYNIEEIKNKIDKVFFNNYGIYLDTRKLYEESITEKVAFNKNLYLRDEYKDKDDYNIENLSIHWSKILGNKFKIKNEIVDIFTIFREALKSNTDFYNKNKSIEIKTIKKDLVNYWADITKDSRNKNKSELDIYNNYKDRCSKRIKHILNYEDLLNHILSSEYKGCIIDFDILSKIYNVNVVFLEKRIKKNNNQGYKIIKCNKSNYYILIYESTINSQSIYNLIGVKNKFLFYLDELSPKFIQEILKIN